MDIPYFNNESSPDVINDALKSCGVVIVQKLISTEEINLIHQELNPYLAHAKPSIDCINDTIAAFFGDKTKHVAGLASKSTTFVSALMCNPTMLSICNSVLLPNCANYQLNLGHLMVRGPESTPQPFHRDEDIWIHLPRPHDEVEVSTMTALVDFTAENGATLIVPGSHQWERGRQPTPNEVKAAVMPAGSSVIYLGSTLHAGGANTTKETWRTGVHMSYAAGWLRTEENNYLTTPPDIAKKLPTLAQEILGYAIHDSIKDRGGYLGMVDLKDPMKELMAL